MAAQCCRIQLSAVAVLILFDEEKKKKSRGRAARKYFVLLRSATGLALHVIYRFPADPRLRYDWESSELRLDYSAGIQDCMLYTFEGD